MKFEEGKVKFEEGKEKFEEGPGAVHGLFCRGGHSPYYVEVLNRDEEKRLRERKIEEHGQCQE